jgi:transcriptional regulator with GAF, ATPase, and Fis domain
MSKPPEIKITAFIEQLQSLPVTQLSKLDSILSDLANHVHDIGEYISGLKKEVKSFNAVKKKKLLTEMKKLQEQLNLLSGMLYDMVYDSHYMDRTLHILGYVSEDVKGLLKELKKGRT